MQFFRASAAAAALLTIATPASAEWRKATSQHFEVYSEGPEKSLADFTARLERFDALLHKVLGIRTRDDGIPRLNVFLVANTASVRKAMNAKRSTIAGFYSARPGGAMIVSPRAMAVSSKLDLDAETILFHEYAHHFMMQNFPVAYPAWYVEGFAEYFSTAEPKADGTATIGRPATHRFYGLGTMSMMPTKALFAGMTGKDAASIDLYYGQSWLLTHYLSFAKDRQGQLSDYLNAMNRGLSSENAAIEAFGPLDKLDKDLEAYKKARRISFLELKNFQVSPPEVKVETLSEAEGALIPFRIQRIDGLDTEDGAAQIAEFRALAQRHAGHPAANDALASIAIAEKKLDEADAANNAYLTYKPNDSRALLRKAEIAMERLEQKSSPTAAEWKQVRPMIVNANRANPNDPLVLTAYYRSFLREGVKPTPVAFDGLRRALQLAPQSSEIRFMLAHHLMQEKRHEEARIVIAPLAYSPHESGSRTAALQMLAKIDGKPAPEGDDDEQEKAEVETKAD